MARAAAMLAACGGNDTAEENAAENIEANLDKPPQLQMIYDRRGVERRCPYPSPH